MEKFTSPKRPQLIHADKSKPMKTIRPSQRHAHLDHTSSSNSKKAGRRMRNRADHKFGKILKGREKINKLMARAGIQSNL